MNKKYSILFLILFLFGCQSAATEGDYSSTDNTNLAKNPELLKEYYDRLDQLEFKVSPSGFVLCDAVEMDKVAIEISKRNPDKDEQVKKIYFLLTNAAGDCRLATKFLPDGVKSGDSSNFDLGIDSLKDSQDEYMEAMNLMKKMGKF